MIHKKALAVVWEFVHESDFLEHLERVLEIVLENDLPILEDGAFDEMVRMSQDEGTVTELLDSGQKPNSHPNGGLK